MKEIKLFNHNEIAYNKLIEALKKSKCTTINHATGTGKSFIALKYMYQNRDKKILYISPTYPIIEQLKSDYSKLGIEEDELQIDTMIYRNLLSMDVKNFYKKYDIIIFDEYHRVGAKQTYKKIKQIKQALDEAGEEKKLIGLTATPIRYLDRQRNMTKEVFNNNIASNLSLSEAMIKGLLPIPKYINSKLACNSELNKQKKKLKRMGNTEQKKKLKEKISKIEEEISIDNKGVKKTIEDNIQNKSGKYIFFCNTINDLNKLKEYADKWFENYPNVKKYEVHSGFKKEENQKQLDKFNNENEGMNLLFCVDILNEGVHVDDIDGVFLFRRTQSPIIYFQQIGRALSFSGKNRDITIFDFVNNFNNHPAIFDIYDEFKAEMKRLISENPENKKEYMEKLKKFKIMDETIDIYKEIDDIATDLDNEKIINSKIDEAIEELLNAPDSSTIFIDKKLKYSYYVIKRYYKYVNNEQFKSLLDAKIIMPENLFMTIEEREDLLKGYGSIHELEKNYTNEFIKKVLDFIDENNRFPNEDAENEEEQKIAKEYLELLPTFNQEISEKIINKSYDKNIELKSYEKVILGLEINAEEIDELILIANERIKKYGFLPEYMSFAIENITYNYNGKKSELLDSILEINEKYFEEKKIEEDKKRAEELTEILEFLNNNSELTYKELKENGMLEKINGLSSRDRAYIKNKYKQLKKNKIKSIIKGKKSFDIDFLCSNVKNLNTDLIKTYNEGLDLQQCVNDSILKITSFIKANGRLPNENDKLNDETILNSEALKEKIEELKQNDCFSFQNNLCSSIDLVQEVIYEQHEDIILQRKLLKYIEFYIKNEHRPLENSKDLYENELTVMYRKECMPKIGEERIKLLNRVFNSKKSMKATIKNYLKNKSDASKAISKDD